MFPVNLQASISIIYGYRYPINGSNDHINRRIGSEDQWNIFWMQKKDPVSEQIQVIVHATETCGCFQILLRFKMSIIISLKRIVWQCSELCD